MTKQLIATICILGLVGMVVGAGALATNTITATVTPGLVSVTVSPDTVGYGSMLMDETKASGTIGATAGTADVDLNIYGTNAEYAEVSGEEDLCPTTGTLDYCTWDLSSSISADDDYVHAYTTDTAEPTGTTLGTAYTTEWVPLDYSANVKTLAEDLAGGATQDFQLDMRTPASAGDETAMGKTYSTTVTVQAVYAH